MGLIRIARISAESKLEITRTKNIERVLSEYKALVNSDDEESQDTKQDLAWEFWNLLRYEEAEAYEKCHAHGPVEDGEWPSKVGRDMISQHGIIDRVVVKGDHGPWVVTSFGATLYRDICVTKDKDD